MLHTTYNHGHNIWRLLILYQIFFSPQVKQRVIISNKHYQIFFSPRVKQRVIISNKHYQVFFSPQVKQSTIISN